MVKNFVELFINLVSFKIELFCRVFYYVVYLIFLSENNIFLYVR